MKMMLSKTCLGVLPLALALNCPATPDISATPPAGYFKLTAQGASDTSLALPLVRRSAWMGRVTTVTASQVTLVTASAVVTGEASPSATAWYYAEFVTGDLAGLSYPVTGNEDGTFALETYGDDLTAHALGSVAVGELGDIVRIRSGWDVASVFGAGGNSVLAPSSAFTGAVYLAGDVVLLPDNQTGGTEKKPAAVIADIDGSGWRRLGAGETDAGGQALPTDTPFTVRRQAYAPIEIVVLGYVATGPRVVRLPTLAEGGEVDFAVTWAHPASRALNEAGLVAVFDSSVDALNVNDLLLDYASARRGFARPPEHALSLIDAHWFEGDTNQDGFFLKPGAGYVLRLRGERPVRYWRQSQPE